MNLQNHYIVCAIERDAPYFEFGYVRNLSGNDVEWSRSEKDALRTNDKDLLEKIAKVISGYGRRGKIDIMPWFFQVLENGKIARRRTFEQDLI